MHLSFVGRVCLLKAVIFGVPLYYMSFFEVSTSVVKKIKKI